MTLVELLAATILAALLMAAVLGVLKSVTRAQKVLARNGPTEGWQARLVNQLEWDLANSRTVVTTAEGFELGGFAGRDFASGAALHCPTSIQYAVRNLGGRSCLVRGEAHLDSLNLDNQSLELVCNQVERIVLGSADGAAPQLSSATKPQKNADDDASIPDQPVVALYGVGQEKPVFEHAFILR
jgi:type II secretory pathway component PulJ